MSKYITLTNCEFNWARLDKPVANPFGTSNYELQIRTSDASQASEWKSHGLPVKAHADGYSFVQLKRKATTAAGKENQPVRVVNRDNSPFDTSKAIGNGSTGNVIIYAFKYEFGGKTGTTFSLTSVQLVNFIEFSKSAPEFDALPEASESSSTAPESKQTEAF